MRRYFLLTSNLYFGNSLTGEVSDNSGSDDSDAKRGGSSSDYSTSESEEEFNDGFDEDLLGDDDDRARLHSMTEKEREEELFNRNERREVMRTRLVCFFFIYMHNSI